MLKFERMAVPIVDQILEYPRLLFEVKTVANWIGKATRDHDQFVVWLMNFCKDKEMNLILEKADGRVAAVEVINRTTGHVFLSHCSLLIK